MSASDYRLDMTMMFAVHEALRRDLVRVARIAASTDGSPAQRLQAVAGWELFKKFLVIHHTSEDRAIWPTLQERVAGRADQAAVVEAMEAEHAAIDPLLAAVDAAAADPDYGSQGFGDLVDALVTSLTGHLRHEENDGLALIDATLTEAEWRHFSDVHRAAIGDDRVRYLPWLLDDATVGARDGLLGGFPPAIQELFRDEWNPAYVALQLWGPNSPSLA